MIVVIKYEIHFIFKYEELFYFILFKINSKKFEIQQIN